MTPIELRIAGFRSFGCERTFRFPTGPGLFFLWGDNRAEPQLGRNGAGKSTLFEALTWLLYGKTSRGLKAGDVASWGYEGPTFVELDFADDDGTIGTMSRTWKPNTWRLTWKGSVTEDLDATNANLPSFQSWLNATFLAQGQPMFLDMKPEQKAVFFSDLLGLDRWAERSTRAGKMATAADEQQRKHENALARAEGEWAGVGSSDRDLEVLSAEWRGRRDARRAELAHMHADACERLRKASIRVEDADAFARAASSALSDATKARGDAEHALQHAGRNSGKCQACGQRVPNKDEDALMLALRYATTVEEKARAISTDEAMNVRNARREVELINRELDNIEAEDDRLADEPDPHIARIAERNARNEALAAEIGRLRTLVTIEDERRRLFDFWVRGFKDLRMRMVAEALAQFEIEANAEASQLGLIDWSVKFEIDRESKTGTVQRGFQVTIEGPGNEGPVPWEAWSGGEGQRLRLAVQMGLANLVRRRVRATFQLEVWDEPTQWMGEQGVDDLLDALRDRAAREQLQVWIVDHRSLGYGGFSGSIGVVKTSRGGSEFVDATYIQGQAAKGT